MQLRSWERLDHSVPIGVSTDPFCFRQMCAATRARTLEAAKAEGKIVLSPEESAKLYPCNGRQLQYNTPVIEVDQPCPFEMKKKWGEVISKLPAGER